MADPFGIIGVIGVAAQIIQIGVQFGLDWKDAPGDARSFIVELQVLKTTLSETNTNIILNPDFVNAFHGRHSTLLSQLGAAVHEPDTRAMVSACHVGLDDLLKDLKKRLQGHCLGWQRLKGTFHARKTREAVENLQRQCSVLNSLVAVDAVALAASTHREVKEGREEQQQMHGTLNHLRDCNDNRETSEERDAILTWLTPADYVPQQNDFLARRQPGTGHWLLDSAEFKEWVAIGKQTLFCPGIPGAGKTILTSVVVEELANRFWDENSIGIAYLYCNFRRHDEQKVDDLLASLLKQLAQNKSSLPEIVKSLHDKHKQKRTRPSLDEVSRTLQAVTTAYSRVFVIVDALDECQPSDGCRAKFLAELFDLQAKCGVSLFATSRYIAEITEKFEGSISLEIRASEDDVRRYVEGHLSRLPSFVGRNPELQEEIKTHIVRAVDGMYVARSDLIRNLLISPRFLLAQLHLDSLVGKRSPKVLRAALTTLHTGSNAYDYAYSDAMERIEGQIADQEELAKQVLAWITCVMRPLTTVELQHALAVEVGDLAFDEENVPQIEDVVSVCAGLVTVDDESNIIRLVHYTTQEYFERTRSYWFPNSETDITEISVTYLSFHIFESGYCQTDKEFEERLQSNPLYDYAAHNWGHHARRAHQGYQSIIRFLVNTKKVEASSQALMAVKTLLSSKYSQNVPQQMTGLHLAAYFGINNVVEILLHTHYIGLKDSCERTPLSYAAEKGHEAVLLLLLSRGADLEAKNKDGLTPLAYASKEGHSAIVQLLLDKGADVEVKDVYGQTPLMSAAIEGHEAVVLLLLKQGSDIETTPIEFYNTGKTPLWYAAMNGREAVVRLLLDKGADIEAKTTGMFDAGRTPLLCAASDGHEGVVRLLLNRGANIEAKDGDGRTPLLHAVARGHETVTQLLLDEGADVKTTDDYGRTPLMYIIGEGHEAIVQLLLLLLLLVFNAEGNRCSQPPEGHGACKETLYAISTVQIRSSLDYPTNQAQWQLVFVAPFP